MVLARKAYAACLEKLHLFFPHLCCTQYIDMIKVDDPSAPIGHKQLSELLRLELAGKVSNGIMLTAFHSQFQGKHFSCDR